MNNPLSEINKNSITLTNLTDHDQDFGKLFDIKHSIIYKECKNININFDTSLNKIILFKCENIKINCNKIISGIDIIKSNKIKIITQPDKPIYSIYSEDSLNILLKISKKMLKETKIDTDSKCITFIN